MSPRASASALSCKIPFLIRRPLGNIVSGRQPTLTRKDYLNGWQKHDLSCLSRSQCRKTFVTFNMHQLTNVTSITSSSQCNHGTNFEFQDRSRHFTTHDINLHGVINFDIRIRVADDPSVVCNSNKNFVSRDKDLHDVAKLEGNFFPFNSM